MRPETIHIERTYPISADKLWQALTNQESMKDWFFEIPNFTTEVGGEFEFYKSNNDKNLMHHCQVVESKAPEIFKFTWRHPKQSQGTSVITWRLIPRRGATTLHLTHEGLENFKDAGENYTHAKFESGWERILGESLNKFLEKSSLAMKS